MKKQMLIISIMFLLVFSIPMEQVEGDYFQFAEGFLFQYYYEENWDKGTNISTSDDIFYYSVSMSFCIVDEFPPEYNCKNINEIDFNGNFDYNQRLDTPKKIDDVTLNGMPQYAVLTNIFTGDVQLVFNNTKYSTAYTFPNADIVHTVITDVSEIVEGNPNPIGIVLFIIFSLVISFGIDIIRNKKNSVFLIIVGYNVTVLYWIIIRWL